MLAIRWFLTLFLVSIATLFAATESENNDFCWSANSVILGDTITGTLYQPVIWSWDQDSVDHFTFNSGSNSGQITITITSDQNIQATLDRYYCGNTREAQDSGTSITLTANLIANTDYYLTLEALSNSNSSYTIALNTAAPCSNFKVDDDKAQCPDACYSTITDAIDAASANQEILICDGTYNENLVLSTNGLTLKGESGNRANVVIQSSAYQPTISFNGTDGVTLDTLSIVDDRSYDAVRINSYTQNSVFRNVSLISTGDAIQSDGSNGRLEIYESVMQGDDDGIDMRGQMNGGVVLSNVSITSADRGIRSDYDLNGGVTLNGVSISAGDKGMDIGNVINDGLSINGLDVNAQQEGLSFKGALNGTITLQNININAKQDAIYFSDNINNDFSLSQAQLISTDARGIYVGNNAYGIFELSNMTINSKEEGLYFTYNKQVLPTISDSDISSSNADGILTYNLSWTTLTLRDSCVKSGQSGKYGLNLSISGSSSHINGNCFYAVNASELARAQSSGNDFLGNYWDGVGGNYTQNNINDTSGLGSCPHGCGGTSPVVLLADWHLDECIWNGNADEVMDSGGNNYHGQSRHNANTDDDHVINRSAIFDGSSYVEIPGFPDLLHNFSIMAWFKTSDRTKQGQRVFADDESNEPSQSGYAISVGDGGAGRVRFYDCSQTNDGIIDSDALVQNNTWYFAAAINDAAHNLRHLYVYDASGNQLDHKTRVIDGVRGSNSTMASIGGETDSGETNNRFIGLIDEVKIFESALSQTQLETFLAHDLGGENYDGTVRMASCCCVPENGNLIANPSFEQLCGSSIVQTWTNVFGGIVNMRNEICGWSMNGAGMETWEHTTGEPASDGNVFIEIDGDAGNVDAIWQTLSTVAGECYEVSVDYQARDAASRLNGLKILWNGDEVYSTDSEPETWEKGISVQVIGTGSDEIRFAESASWDDSYGSWIDNVRLGVCTTSTTNFRVDAWDVFRDIHDRNISTKIAAQPFSLTLASLNETNDGYQEFNGTVCSRIVGASPEVWVKSSFMDANTTTVTYNVTNAIKESRIDIRWWKDTDAASVTCNDESDNNRTLSSDNFSVRPERFTCKLDNSPLVAEHLYPMTITATQYQQELAVADYNTSAFSVNTRLYMNNGEQNNSLSGVLNRTDLDGFEDGNCSGSITFNDAGIVGIDINDSAWAQVDADDTPLSQRVIYNECNRTFGAHHFDVQLTRPVIENNTTFTYLSNDLNMSAWIRNLNVRFSAQGEANGTLLNYQEPQTLYFAKNVDVTPQLIIPAAPHGAAISINTPVAKLDTNLSFVAGRADINYTDVRFNYPRHFDVPRDPFIILGSDGNFSVSINETASAGVNGSADTDMDANATFYFGRLHPKDLKSTDNPATIAIEIEVYDDSGSNYVQNFRQNSLHWYRHANHNSDVAGDANSIHPRRSSILDDTDSFNINDITIADPAQGTIGVSIVKNNGRHYLHVKTGSWLWYAPLGFGTDYNDSTGSSCLQHPCFIYLSQDHDSGSDIATGNFSGSDFNASDRGDYTRKGMKVFR